MTFARSDAQLVIRQVPRSRMPGHAALVPFVRLLRGAQAQRVEDHEHRRARHRGACQHGGEQARDRQRHHQHVVEERPEQVLLDDAQCPTRHPDRGRRRCQRRVHERHVRDLDRHIRARSHRDAQALRARLREGGRVVDAVAHHRDRTALGLQVSDGVALAVGQDARDDASIPT